MAKRKAIHINEARRLLDHARIDADTVDVSCWRSTGEIIEYRGWRVKGVNWRGGWHRLQNPLNGEVRAVRDITIFKINGFAVYL